MTVVPFPALNDVDAQWLELERQRRLVREQTSLINNDNNQTRESKEDAMLTINNVHKQREAFYRRLSDFDRFGRGWLRRNDETRDQALKMAAAGAS